MRPAQLRRFATAESRERPNAHARFNEAGAAAPVCHGLISLQGRRPPGFNEAGAAAPVCPIGPAMRRGRYMSLQ